MSKKRKTTIPTNLIGVSYTNRRSGVFFDTHSAILDNNPPVTFISGVPGMGKTFLMQCLMTMDIEMRKDVLAIDWKGDLAGVASNPEIQDRCEVVELGKGEDAGMLDPMYSSNDIAVKLENTLAVVDILLGGLTLTQRTKVVPHISKTLASTTVRPSMSALVQSLMYANDDEVQSIGSTLQMVSQTKTGRILFHQDRHKPPRPLSGTIGGKDGEGRARIITVLDLKLPKNEKDAQNSESGRKAVAIFYMIASYIYETLEASNAKVKKSVYIDEAWAIAQVEVGATVLEKIALLGRSRAVALIIASQNYAHIAKAGIGSTISNHFAFRAGQKESKLATISIGLPSRWRKELTTLPETICIMRNHKKQFGILENTLPEYNPHWASIFETNPFKKE